jgi:mono/diheme cytochrome c family protein
MKKPPLRFLEVVASFLALLGILILVAAVAVFRLPTSDPNPSATTVEAGVTNSYDEQKALAAGLQPDLTGKQLFNNNCKQCHAVDAVVVGPALGNVTNRRSTEWLHAFIKNSSKVIQGGDPVAKELFEKYNRTQMPSFNFSEDEINAILSHIKFETAAHGM